MSFVDVLLAILETLGMTLIGTVLAYVLGFPLGILLNITSKNGIKPNKVLNSILGTFVNVMRSIPCLLLIVILLPFTRMLLGRSTGEWYVMIIPIFVGAFGFVARIVESSLNEVDGGVIDAIKSMGASTWQIIKKVLLTEAMPSLVSGFAVSVVSIIGYTSFAGYIAGGGLIYHAFNLGYYGTETVGMWLCILFVIIIVQLIQEGGLFISKKLDKRRK